jgi:hypothetical protein
VYFPQREKLLEAIHRVKGTPEDFPDCEWQVRVDDPSLRELLTALDVALAANESADYTFYAL